MDNLIELIDSKQGENIFAIDIEKISPLTKYIVIVTANSMVHSKSLAKYIMDFFYTCGYNHLFTKNIDFNNPWILIDNLDIIINIFQRETREFYSLEKLFFQGKIIKNI